MRTKRTIPIKIADSAGIKISLREKEIYFLVNMTTKTTENEIRADAPAKPLNPKRYIRRGVHAQVVTTQNTMRDSDTLIFPIALRAFVKGVDIEERAAFKAKRAKEIRAGSHL